MVDNESLFSGRLTSGRTLLEALQSLYSASDKAEDVEVSGGSSSREGMRFTVCTPGIMLASVMIPARAFSDFHTGDSRVRVNLSLLVDCLALPYSSEHLVGTKLSCTYDSLRLTLVEADSVSESCLRTVEGEQGEIDALKREMSARDIVASAILESDALREAISELDYGGADTACVCMATTSPRFVLSAPAGRKPSCEVQFADPFDSTQETFHEFKCERSITATFRLSLLHRVMKALAVSDTCKVRMNEQGSLSIVCRMKSSSPVSAADRCFLEFLIIAQEVEDEDDDEND